MTDKCSVCGRFVSFGCDEGVPYGGYGDYEPPPSQYFCGQCAKHRALRLADNGSAWEVWWVEPAYMGVAKSILRHRRKSTACGKEDRADG